MVKVKERDFLKTFFRYPSDITDCVVKMHMAQKNQEPYELHPIIIEPLKGIISLNEQIFAPAGTYYADVEVTFPDGIVQSSSTFLIEVVEKQIEFSNKYIQSLFAPDDKAVFFDFAAITNLYENFAATTPAAVGNPVGAMLDLSRGLEIDSTDLALGSVLRPSTWNRTGNTFSTVDPDNGVVAGTICILEAEKGKTYKVTVVSNRTSATGSFQVGVRSADNTANITVLNIANTAGTTVVANVLLNPAEASNSQALYLYASGWRGTATVTIQEIKGNHAFQPTTSNMPMLRQTPQTGRYWLESIDANRALNITFASAPGTMYVGCNTPEGMVWTTENWSTIARNVLGGAGSYSAGMVARGREFSAAEKVLVEAYFARQAPTLGAQFIANSEFDEGETGWLNPYPLRYSVANGKLTYLANGTTGNAPFSPNTKPVGQFLIEVVTAATRAGNVRFRCSPAVPIDVFGTTLPIGAAKRAIVLDGVEFGPYPAAAATGDWDIDAVRAWEIL